MKVYEAIRHVTHAMSTAGIEKGRKNASQGYNFRGIDDVLNSLSGPLCDAGLTILPRVTERVVTERETKNGGAMFSVTVKVEFDFVAAEDGSKHTVVTYGEAMDSGDKATNKAMSAAYKYMALLAFCVPTEPSPETDADFTSHEVRSRAPAPPPPPPADGLAGGDLATMKHAIATAADLKALRAHFNEAIRAANEVGDTPSVEALTKVKDIRKAALESKTGEPA